MARIKRETSFLTDDAYEAMYERIVSFIFNRTGNFLINYPNTIHNDIDSMYMNEKNVLITTFISNISAMGYIVSEDVVDHLKEQTKQELERLILPTLLKVVRKSVGADKKYKLFYPAFPSQVMEMSEAELFISAYFHYLGLCNEWSSEEIFEKMPSYEKDMISKYIGSETKTKIGYNHPNVLLTTFAEIVKSPISISDAEKEFVKLIILKYCWKSTIFENIVKEYNLDNLNSREVAAYCAAQVFKVPPVVGMVIPQSWVKTPTDTLRLYCALCDGDISLATPTRFFNMNKNDARRFLYIVCKTINDDNIIMFKQYNERWKRLFERLHPNSAIYDRVPNINKLRKAVLPALYTDDWSEISPTFNSLLVKAIETAKASQKTEPIINLFDAHKNKKTVYARHLEHFIRLFWETDKEKDIVNRNWWAIFKYFKENIVDDIPSHICIQMINHFRIEKSSDTEHPRIFFIKSEDNTKMWVDYDHANEKLSFDCYNMIIGSLMESLKKRYKNSDTELGSYYIDPKMYDYIVPLGNRGKTFTNKNVERGSKISYDEDVRYITPYIWWTNDADNNRTDIDLSAIFIRENDKTIYTKVDPYYHTWLMEPDFVSYTNKRLSSDNGFIAIHSGDIVDGGPIDGDGVSEMIHIDVEKARKYGYRYVVIGAYLYSQSNHDEQSFKNVNMTMGVMTNSDPDIDTRTMITKYDAEKVEFNFQPSSNSTKIVPMIIDLVNRQFIWADMAVGSISTICNRVENSGMDIKSVILQTINNSMKLSIGELLELYDSASNGNIRMLNREHADTTFGLDEGDITPFNFHSLQLT